MLVELSRIAVRTTRSGGAADDMRKGWRRRAGIMLMHYTIKIVNTVN